MKELIKFNRVVNSFRIRIELEIELIPPVKIYGYGTPFLNKRNKSKYPNLGIRILNIRILIETKKRKNG